MYNEMGWNGIVQFIFSYTGAPLCSLHAFRFRTAYRTELHSVRSVTASVAGVGSHAALVSCLHKNVKSRRHKYYRHASSQARTGSSACTCLHPRVPQSTGSLCKRVSGRQGAAGQAKTPLGPRARNARRCSGLLRRASGAVCLPSVNKDVGFPF